MQVILSEPLQPKPLHPTALFRINGLHSTLHRRDQGKRFHPAGDRSRSQNAWLRQLTRRGERVRGSGFSGNISFPVTLQDGRCPVRTEFRALEGGNPLPPADAMDCVPPVRGRHGGRPSPCASGHTFHESALIAGIHSVTNP